MYGLSFTASLLCASATRRLASDTRRAISSVTIREPGAGDPVAGVGPLDMVGEGVIPGVEIETAGFVGAGALIVVGGVQPSALVLKAANFAAISARFCNITSADVCLHKDISFSIESE